MNKSRFVNLPFVGMMGLLVLFFALLPVSKVSAQLTVDVFLHDFVGDHTNVRESPKGKIKTVLNHDEDYEPCFQLYNYTNGWWQILECVDAMETSDATMAACKKANGGWIHYSCVGFATRNYGGQRISLYSSPNTKSKVVYSFKEEIMLRPVGVAKGGWVKVKTVDGKHEGWIHDEWICANPLTNCC